MPKQGIVVMYSVLYSVTDPWTSFLQKKVLHIVSVEDAVIQLLGPMTWGTLSTEHLTYNALLKITAQINYCQSDLLCTNVEKK